MEDAPAVILQGHLDMVCVKDTGSSHDFTKDPVIPLREGDYITADGLKGGHSGMDIGTSPENLYRRFASFLSGLSDLKPAVTDIKGEGKINAIPTNCTVTFFIPEEGEKLLLPLYRRFEKEFNDIYSNPDSTPRISLTKTDTARVGALTDQGLKTLPDLILNLPAGVLRRNEEMGGQVSTSANPGVLRVDGLNNTHLEISLRSDQQEELDEGERNIKELIGRAGLHVSNTTTYPPWPPAPGSRLVSLCRSCREGIFTEPVEIVTVHAGLECGILSAKAGGIEAVSMGPNLFDVHTTRERIQWSFVGKFITWLQTILARQDELK